MASVNKSDYRQPLHRGVLDPNRVRATQAGMWAWLWQRISALAILVFLGLHLILTYRPFLQFCLLFAVTFHAVLGLRVILIDFGLVHVKYQKALLVGLGVLGAVMLAIVWFGIY